MKNIQNIWGSSNKYEKKISNPIGKMGRNIEDTVMEVSK